MLILGIFDIPMWILLILLLVFGLFMYTEKVHRTFNKCGLTGPKPAPLVGGLPILVKKGLNTFAQDATAEYGKCFSFFMGNSPVVFTTDIDVIKEIFVKRFSDFSARSLQSHITKFWENSVLMSPEYGHWKFLRSTLLSCFSTSSIKRTNPLILSCLDKITREIMKKLKTSNEVEMQAMVSSLSMDFICRLACSIEIDQDEEFVKQVHSLVNLSLDTNPVTLLTILIPDAKRLWKLFDIDYNNTKAIKYVSNVLLDLIEEKKKCSSERSEDLLQFMIDSQEECLKIQPKRADQTQAGMTDEEIVANAITFLFAGHDTTTNTLTFSIYCLTIEQECQEKLRREIQNKIGDSEPTHDSVNELEYMEMFLSEVLRLYPPAWVINRHNKDTTTIGQYTFPPDVPIYISIFTLHRMEEYWKDPLEFDPGRFSRENKPNILPYTYMPFGVGPRNCIGMKLAKMVVKITLVKLLQTFKFSPSETLKIPIELKKDFFCKPKGGVPVKLEIINP